MSDEELTAESERFVNWFLLLLSETGAPITPPTTSVRAMWADTYQKLRRIDGKTKEQIVAVCRWARNDTFWQRNFLSPAKLRQKKDGISYFDSFTVKMSSPTTSTARKAFFA